MKYDSVLIGERIKQARIDKGIKTKAEMLRLLESKHFAISRNTYSDIENGNIENFDWRILSILCEVLDCEVGYLLGEFDYKTGRQTDVVNATGLSEEAVKKLLQISFYNEKKGLSEILNLLICDPNFTYFLELLGYIPSGSKRTLIQNNNIISFSDEAIVSNELRRTVDNIANQIKAYYKDKRYPVE